MFKFRITQQDVARNHLTDLRNHLALQHGLHRGDLDVTLHNTKWIDTKFRREVRTNFAEGEDPEKEHRCCYPPWAADRKPQNIDEEAFKKRIPHVQWEGFELNMIKVLACGGFGAATLWEAKFEDGDTLQVVIKMGLKGNYDAQGERLWHQRYNGNDHTVQVYDLHQIGQQRREEALQAYQAGGVEPPKYSGEVFDMQALNMVVLEYVSGGDLFSLLSKAEKLDVELSNKVLWGFFECFVIGLSAIAWQPRCNDDYEDSFEDMLRDARAVGKEHEFIDLLTQYHPFHDVHMDIEEQNILVGFDAHHNHNPVLAFHDFGSPYSLNMTESWRTWREEEYWYARQAPKPTRLTPEQVHKRWDLLDTDLSHDGKRFRGANLTRGEEIVGRYGVWTNIFRVGSMMESMITGSWKNHPFTAKPYTTLDGRKTELTYGWRLNLPQYSHIEEQLRDIICQCMFERPIDRPGLPSLLLQVFHRQNVGFVEGDQETLDFWTDFFEPGTPDPIQQVNATVAQGGVQQATEPTNPNTPERIQALQAKLSNQQPSPDPNRPKGGLSQIPKPVSGDVIMFSNSRASGQVPAAGGRVQGAAEHTNPNIPRRVQPQAAEGSNREPSRKKRSFEWVFDKISADMAHLGPNLPGRPFPIRKPDVPEQTQFQTAPEDVMDLDSHNTAHRVQAGEAKGNAGIDKGKRRTESLRVPGQWPKTSREIPAPAMGSGKGKGVDRGAPSYLPQLGPRRPTPPEVRKWEEAKLKGRLYFPDAASPSAGPAPQVTPSDPEPRIKGPWDTPTPGPPRLTYRRPWGLPRLVVQQPFTFAHGHGFPNLPGGARAETNTGASPEKVESIDRDDDVDMDDASNDGFARYTIAVPDGSSEGEEEEDDAMEDLAGSGWSTQYASTAATSVADENAPEVDMKDGDDDNAENESEDEGDEDQDPHYLEQPTKRQRTQESEASQSTRAPQSGAKSAPPFGSQRKNPIEFKRRRPPYIPLQKVRFASTPTFHSPPQFSSISGSEPAGQSTRSQPPLQFGSESANQSTRHQSVLQSAPEPANQSIHFQTLPQTTYQLSNTQIPQTKNPARLLEIGRDLVPLKVKGSKVAKPPRTDDRAAHLDQYIGQNLPAMPTALQNIVARSDALQTKAEQDAEEEEALRQQRVWDNWYEQRRVTREAGLEEPLRGMGYDLKKPESESESD